MTPQNVYFGRQEGILKRREEQKQTGIYYRFRYNLGKSSDQPQGELGGETYCHLASQVVSNGLSALNIFDRVLRQAKVNV